MENFVRLLERIAVISGDLSRLAISMALLIMCVIIFLY